MKVAVAHLESISPLGFSKHYEIEKKEKESPDDFERRTWRERTHYNKDGKVFIPPMAFKNTLANAAAFLSEKIPGKGQAKWTKHFLAGVLVVDPLVLPVKKDEIPGVWLFVPSDGRKGGGKRVNRCFPVVQEWSGTVEFFVLDDLITKPVFEKYLKEAGNFIGLLFFRPQNGGYYGRFSVRKIEWRDE